MATVQVHEGHRHIGGERTFLEMTGAGSMLEIAGGVGAIALTILALCNIIPFYLTAIAAIVVGASLLMEGLSIVARFSRLAPEEPAVSAPHTVRFETGGGVSAEMFCGAAGIALGILALCKLVPITLLAIAVITMGAGLVLCSGTRAYMRRQHLDGFQVHEFASAIARESMRAVLFVELCVGVGAVVLGILALIGNAPLTLVEIGLLALGCGVLLGGSELTGRFLGFIHR